MEVKKLLRYFACFLLLFTQQYMVNAQQFPVHVTPVLAPPYSLYLSDYASADGNLQLIINLRELDRPSYRVRLRLTIEGPGVTLRTSSTYNPQPIVLQGGVAEMLTGADIKGYFNPDNLDFTGLTKQDFIKKGALPEGFYTFKFEVIDHFRNVVVSNQGLANAWIILNDPPMVNLPFNNEKIVATDPQNVTFSWTPRHTASPNAAFTTEYEFTLVELYPDNRDPNDAIRSSKSIFRTTTSLTSLNYGMTETLLIPGRKYAFRVQAIDTEGRDLFKNNGYSEVFVFQFGDACIAPPGVKADPLDDARIKVTWDQNELHTGFAIQFRKKGSSTWNDQNTYSTSAVVPGLLPNTAYQFQVRGTCGTVQGQFSSILETKTLEGNPSEFACGTPPPAIEIKTTPLDRELAPLDIIKTADFDIIVTEVEANGDGSFKGKGKAMMPWFKLATVGVKFSNIKVNEDLRVFSGNVTTIYTKSSRFVAQIDASGEDTDEGSGGTPPDNAIPEDTVVVDVDIKEVTVGAGSDGGSELDVIVIVAEDGSKQEIPREKDEDGNFKDTLVKDEKGDTWIVGSDGKVTQGGSTAGPEAVASLDDIDYNVTFKAAPDQDYGFDSKDGGFTDYEKVQIKGKDYDVAWKSIESGRIDRVVAIAGDEATFPSVVGFKSNGAELPKQPGAAASEKVITVTGKTEGTEEEVSAYVLVKEDASAEAKAVDIGKLNVVSYDKIRRKLVIVPVNDVSKVPDASTLQTELNRIYQQAVVEWDVEISQPFAYEKEELKGLDAQESDFLSSFPEKMQILNRTYKNSIFMDANSYYVFIVEGTGSKRDGFMPFKRKFGYIFAENVGDIETTIAHELGHGAFRLRHTFSPEEFKAAQGSTKNLMDYNNGTELKKFQWDRVHNPENMNGWLEGDAESGQVSMGMAQFSGFQNTSDNSVTFISPAGKYITLPATTKKVNFSTLDRLFKVENNAVTDDITSGQLPIGSLISFTDKDGAIHSARISGGAFLGYFKKGTDEKYPDKLTTIHKPTSGVALFLGVEDGDFVSYISKFTPSNGAEAITDANAYYAAGPNILDFTMLANLDFLGKKDTEFKTWLTENVKGELKVVSSSDFNFYFPSQDVSLLYQINPQPLKEFLKARLSEDKTLKDYLFYFTLVNLTTNLLTAFDDCAKEQIRLEQLRAIESFHRALATALSGASGRLNEASAIRTRFEEATLKELFGRAAGQTTVVAELEKALADKADVVAIHNILKKERGVCAYSGLKYETRKALIDKLVAADNNYWYVDPSLFGSDGNFILKQLIESTPSDQRVNLLKQGFMASDNKWLRLLWTQALGFANGVEFNDVVDIFYVVRSWVLPNFSQLGITPTKKPFTVLLVDTQTGALTFSQSEYAAGRDVFYLSDAAKKFSFTTAFKGSPRQFEGYVVDKRPDADFLETGKVYLKERVKLTDVTTLVSSADSPPYDRDTEQFYDQAFHPFEPVTLMLAHGSEPVKQLQIGESFMDISLMGLVYQNRINKEVTDAALRDLGNGAAMLVAILAAAETGGGSLVAYSSYVAQVAGVVSAMDVVVQQERRALIQAGRYDEYQDFFSAWDDVHTTVGAVDLLAGGVVGVSKLSRVNFANSTKNFAAAVKNTRNLPSRILTAWNDAWSISSKEAVFVQKLENAGFVFLKNEFNVLENATKLKFVEQFGEQSLDVLKVFNENPSLLQGWNVLKDTRLFADVNAIKIAQKYLKDFPANQSKIKDFLTNVSEYRWPDGNLASYPVQEAISKVYGKKLDEIFSQLTGEELVAIHHYSRGISFPFNQALRGTNTMTDFFRYFDDFLQKGLNKLPNHVGTVHRGTSLPETYVLSKYGDAFKNNAHVSEQAYTSSSKVTDFLSNYMARKADPTDVNVVFKIESKTGKDIERISNFGSSFPENVNHKEVLFKPGTQFKVTSFKPIMDESNNLKYYEIFLSEI